MAITIDDFSKIWASTSPLVPYSFSDANYQEGWNFIGSTPPSRQMWDFLQKNNDEKMQYLANNYLPLSGGTMTGAITRNGTALTCSSNDSYMQVNGSTNGSNGAYLALFGKDSAYQGCFSLCSNNGTLQKDFIGKPDGTLTWIGKEIERVNASGTGYIRYESGLQICWGEETKSVTLTQISSTGIYYTNVTITLPLSFKDANYVVSAISRYSTGHTLACGFTPNNTGSVSGQVYDFVARTGDMKIWWHAIGWWK